MINLTREQTQQLRDLYDENLQRAKKAAKLGRSAFEIYSSVFNSWPGCRLRKDLEDTAGIQPAINHYLKSSEAILIALKDRRDYLDDILKQGKHL